MSCGYMKLPTFRAYARFNSGQHFLDSGGAYGRHHEKPDLPAEGELSVVKEWAKGSSAVLCTAAYLEATFEIDEELHAKFDEFKDRPENADLSWFELAANFMEAEGLVNCNLDGNTYNGSSDLDQEICYHVYATKDASGDHLYAGDDVVTTVFIHTGCDVRGGYSAPIFCRGFDYSIPVDTKAGYTIEDGRRYRRIKHRQPAELFIARGIADSPFTPGPELLTDEERDHLSEKWQVGYSDWPYGALRDSVERWFEFTRTRDTVCVKLHSGELVKVMVESPVY